MSQGEPMFSDDAGRPPANDGGIISGAFRHQQVSARVPESVARGVFSTGAIVITNANEFIIDFLIRMARPHQVAARVVLPPAVVPNVIRALREALQRWAERFGPIPSLPKPDPGPRPSIQEVYEDLKLPDEQLSGAYANSVMISFSAAEFSFDFITNFFPRSSVSARVYLAVPQVPRFVEAMEQTFQEHLKRVAAQRGQQGPDAPPPAQPGSPPADDEMNPPGPAI